MPPSPWRPHCSGLRPFQAVEAVPDPSLSILNVAPVEVKGQGWESLREAVKTRPRSERKFRGPSREGRGLEVEVLIGEPGDGGRREGAGGGRRAPRRSLGPRAVLPCPAGAGTRAGQGAGFHGLCAPVAFLSVNIYLHPASLQKRVRLPAHG